MTAAKKTRKYSSFNNVLFKTVLDFYMRPSTKNVQILRDFCCLY